MLLITALISASFFLAAAATPDIDVLLASQIAKRQDDEKCEEGLKACMRGCIAKTEICCADPERDEPWSCKVGEICGTSPRFGCSKPRTTTASLTLSATATSALSPGDPDLNPSLTGSSQFYLPETTSNGRNEMPDSTSAASPPTRQTCSFEMAAVGLYASSSTNTPEEGCPGALTSAADYGASGAAVRVESLLIMVAMGAAVVALVGGLA
ncbi:hypothetical protein CKAH01_05210 [Colletotrichum kahawae]|uniref:GPI anchored serine-threonine rich protein n=1 Tax=Colletotrichum kahawae TaxID=34407 RepID=A0AAD9YG45_COLKA|nr:hypothetical protein CKAH01_05210 [Colletotrichum kahawae]